MYLANLTISIQTTDKDPTSSPPQSFRAELQRAAEQSAPHNNRRIVQKENIIMSLPEYNPLRAGQIDGDLPENGRAHDRALWRAHLYLSQKQPQFSSFASSSSANSAPDATHCLFVGRLAAETQSEQLENLIKCHVDDQRMVKNVQVVRDRVTGTSRRYAFVTCTSRSACQQIYRRVHSLELDGKQLLVDWMRGRGGQPNWVPRRLGGGLGGRIQSGQLRFGGRDCPFRQKRSADNRNGQQHDQSSRFYRRQKSNRHHLK